MKSIRKTVEALAGLRGGPRLLAILAVSMLAMPRAALAARPITVGDGTAASCTDIALQNAVFVADADGGGKIRFRCGAAPVTITLTATNDAALTFHNDTTIDGGGLVSLQVSGRLALIDSDASVVLKSLAVRCFGPLSLVTNLGTLTILNSVISGGGGGAVDNYGTLNVRNSTIRDKAPESAILNRNTMTVDHSAFIHNLVAIQNVGSLSMKNSIMSGNGGGPAGGIINGGTLTIDNSDFFDNEGDEAGAIKAGGGSSAIIKNSSFYRNHVGVGSGGGAIANEGTTTVVNCQFFENEAFEGAGILNYAALVITNSTFLGNRATYKGGAIYTTEALTIVKSTISSNTAGQDGGGIYATGGIAPTLIRTSVSGNTPNDVVVQP